MITDIFASATWHLKLLITTKNGKNVGRFLFFAFFFHVPTSNAVQYFSSSTYFRYTSRPSVEELNEGIGFKQHVQKIGQVLACASALEYKIINPTSVEAETFLWKVWFSHMNGSRWVNRNSEVPVYWYSSLYSSEPVLAPLTTISTATTSPPPPPGGVPSHKIVFGTQQRNSEIFLRFCADIELLQTRVSDMVRMCTVEWICKRADLLRILVTPLAGTVAFSLGTLLFVVPVRILLRMAMNAGEFGYYVKRRLIDLQLPQILTLYVGDSMRDTLYRETETGRPEPPSLLKGSAAAIQSTSLSSFDKANPEPYKEEEEEFKTSPVLHPKRLSPSCKVATYAGAGLNVTRVSAATESIRMMEYRAHDGDEKPLNQPNWYGRAAWSERSMHGPNFVPRFVSTTSRHRSPSPINPEVTARPKKKRNRRERTSSPVSSEQASSSGSEPTRGSSPDAPLSSSSLRSNLPSEEARPGAFRTSFAIRFSRSAAEAIDDETTSSSSSSPIISLPYRKSAGPFPARTGTRVRTKEKKQKKEKNEPKVPLVEPKPQKASSSVPHTPFSPFAAPSGYSTDEDGDDEEKKKFDRSPNFDPMENIANIDKLLFHSEDEKPEQEEEEIVESLLEAQERKQRKRRRKERRMEWIQQQEVPEELKYEICEKPFAPGRYQRIYKEDGRKLENTVLVNKVVTRELQTDSGVFGVQMIGNLCGLLLAYLRMTSVGEEMDDFLESFDLDYLVNLDPNPASIVLPPVKEDRSNLAEATAMAQLWHNAMAKCLTEKVGIWHIVLVPEHIATTPYAVEQVIVELSGVGMYVTGSGIHFTEGLLFVQGVLQYSSLNFATLNLSGQRDTYCLSAFNLLHFNFDVIGGTFSKMPTKTETATAPFAEDYSDLEDRLKVKEAKEKMAEQKRRRSAELAREGISTKESPQEAASGDDESSDLESDGDEQYRALHRCVVGTWFAWKRDSRDFEESDSESSEEEEKKDVGGDEDDKKGDKKDDEYKELLCSPRMLHSVEKLIVNGRKAQNDVRWLQRTLKRLGPQSLQRHFNRLLEVARMLQIVVNPRLTRTEQSAAMSARIAVLQEEYDCQIDIRDYLGAPSLINIPEGGEETGRFHFRVQSYLTLQPLLQIIRAHIARYFTSYLELDIELLQRWRLKRELISWEAHKLHLAKAHLPISEDDIEEFTKHGKSGDYGRLTRRLKKFFEKTISGQSDTIHHAEYDEWLEPVQEHTLSLRDVPSIRKRSVGGERSSASHFYPKMEKLREDLRKRHISHVRNIKQTTSKLLENCNVVPITVKAVLDKLPTPKIEFSDFAMKWARDVDPLRMEHDNLGYEDAWSILPFDERSLSPKLLIFIEKMKATIRSDVDAKHLASLLHFLMLPPIAMEWADRPSTEAKKDEEEKIEQISDVQSVVMDISSSETASSSQVTTPIPRAVSSTVRIGPIDEGGEILASSAPNATDTSTKPAQVLLDQPVYTKQLTNADVDEMIAKWNQIFCLCHLVNPSDVRLTRDNILGYLEATRKLSLLIYSVKANNKFKQEMSDNNPTEPFDGSPIAANSDFRRLAETVHGQDIVPIAYDDGLDRWKEMAKIEGTFRSETRLETQLEVVNRSQLFKGFVQALNKRKMKREKNEKEKKGEIKEIKSETKETKSEIKETLGETKEKLDESKEKFDDEEEEIKKSAEEGAIEPEFLGDMKELINTEEDRVPKAYWRRRAPFPYDSVEMWLSISKSASFSLQGAELMNTVYQSHDYYPSNFTAQQRHSIVTPLIRNLTPIPRKSMTPPPPVPKPSHTLSEEAPRSQTPPPTHFKGVYSDWYPTGHFRTLGSAKFPIPEYCPKK